MRLEDRELNGVYRGSAYSFVRHIIKFLWKRVSSTVWRINSRYIRVLPAATPSSGFWSVSRNATRTASIRALPMQKKGLHVTFGLARRLIQPGGCYDLVLARPSPCFAVSSLQSRLYPRRRPHPFSRNRRQHRHLPAH